MKTSYQIAVLMLAALVAATPFDCPPAPAVTVTLGSAYSASSATSIMSAFKAENTAATTVTVNISTAVSILALRTAQITSSPEAGSTATTDGSGNYMTVAVTNLVGNDVSLSFGSNAGNPSPTALHDNGFTQYAFPTGWAGRICVGPNFNPNGSKIEGSYTGPPDIDISYVDGYSMPITCSSEDTPVSGCNIDLFKQPNIPCINKVEGPVCLNPAQSIADGPAPPFFAACKGAAYTYPNDNDANVSNLKSTLVSCCIGTLCNAPSRQPKHDNTPYRERMRHRDTRRQLRGKSTSSSLRHRHHHHLPRYIIDG